MHRASIKRGTPLAVTDAGVSIQTGRHNAARTNGGRMVTQPTAEFWAGGSNPGQPMSSAVRLSNRRPKSSRFGCITIQPLLAVTEIFHGAVVKEEGRFGNCISGLACRSRDGGCLMHTHTGFPREPTRHPLIPPMSRPVHVAIDLGAVLLFIVWNLRRLTGLSAWALYTLSRRCVIGL